MKPKINARNYCTLYFEYFKQRDSGNSFIRFGSFLLKTQADLSGEKSNIGKYYMQISQEFRAWKPLVFLTLQYGGGLGITNPREFSYYITNTYEIGVSYHYRVGSAYLSSILFYKYVPYGRPSRDFLYTMYFYQGLQNYRWELSGDFSVWSENRNHGDQVTAGLSGKQFFFFAEPQCWIKATNALSFGTKWNIYYHVNVPANLWEIYPALAVRLKMN